ncbi:uncharacterized protein LOC129768749 [Toxorhynchites rutilus septentrionalis]|uniref:uncharacterized protein LOC129768749 n=1 Tax=Toxorhynchites rutilus septentrionalis TaxID=329112 RepID=UPI00247A5685|nr:uncharacterized protein LOC129768749 [Toxorhynchites rutilus septentrionalis]
MTFERAILLMLAVLIVVPKARAKQNEQTGAEISELDMFNELKLAYVKESYINESFESLNGFTQNASFCIQDKVNGSNTSDREQFSASYCPQMREAIGCLSPAIDEIRKRLNEDGLEMVEILMNFISQAIELACKNKGEIFFDHGVDQNCRHNLGKGLESCLSIGFTKQTQCDDLVKMRKCLVTKLNECNASRLMEFFDLLYQPLRKTVDCKHILLIHLLSTIGIA